MALAALSRALLCARQAAGLLKVFRGRVFRWAPTSAHTFRDTEPPTLNISLTMISLSLSPFLGFMTKWPSEMAKLQGPQSAPLKGPYPVHSPPGRWAGADHQCLYPTPYGYEFPSTRLRIGMFWCLCFPINEMGVLIEPISRVTVRIACLAHSRCSLNTGCLF